MTVAAQKPASTTAISTVLPTGIHDRDDVYQIGFDSHSSSDYHDLWSRKIIDISNRGRFYDNEGINRAEKSFLSRLSPIIGSSWLSEYSGIEDSISKNSITKKSIRPSDATQSSNSVFKFSYPKISSENSSALYEEKGSSNEFLFYLTILNSTFDVGKIPSLNTSLETKSLKELDRIFSNTDRANLRTGHQNEFTQGLDSLFLKLGEEIFQHIYQYLTTSNTESIVTSAVLEWIGINSENIDNNDRDNIVRFGLQHSSKYVRDSALIAISHILTDKLVQILKMHSMNEEIPELRKDMQDLIESYG
tara:strand:- start:1493 stop:2407 length:915 start_codon:yes stop_codon:yes gene_type:complete